MKTSIVIAAYNEEKTIGNVIKDLKKHGYRDIVVVDDGSKDRTSLIAKRQKITVLKYIINRGQGAALKTGIDFALLKGAEVIVTFDADGQHKASDIKNLIEPVKNKKVDVALGSRFINQDNDVPFSRKLVLKGGALLMRIFYGANLTDSHNGFRALSRKAAQKIEISSNGMEHGSEIIEEIIKKKLKYAEIPVDIHYSDYSKMHGQSSLNAFKILFKMIIKKIVG